MDPTNIAALATAIAGLVTALYQWMRLFGLPGRGPRTPAGPGVGRRGRSRGQGPWLRYLEARLAAAERALDDCLQSRTPRTAAARPSPHRTRPDRWIAPHHGPGVAPGPGRNPVS